MGDKGLETVPGITSNSCWKDIRLPAPGEAKPCLFLDRDGVVVEEVNYLHRPEDVRLISGAARIIRQANELGWVCGLVTNQAGIGRGYYDWPDFMAVQQTIDRELANSGAKLDFVLACPFHAEASRSEYRHAAHPWRKPHPGMLLEICKHFELDLGKSVIVGDQLTDIDAGKRAGIANRYLVLTGHGSRQPEASSSGDAHGYRTIASIADLELPPPTEPERA
ncbi:D-glycero-alpha-D-manno-heptose-1,7-bisphosphate 7-phosphatase [Hoeflea sp.]|uniref:D-glycero-alpha-D-manno-heptose-1,7-bisphosphate 7-phosphatase n=1 Tax=Hoeflea sp. TaxID=1940281 RepID=UPI003B522C5A